MSKKNISFVGLGKLGLPLATNFAKNGNKVIAIDKNEDLLKTLRQTKAPWVEDGLQENIESAKPHIKYTNDYSLVADTDISIILVNTPSVKKDGSFSNLYVEQSLESICKELVAAKKQMHHFILSSTVMPRSIKDSFIPLIESITGWELANGDFGFSYVPDFVAIGQIIRDFENPDFLLVGSSEELYADEAEGLYQSILQNNPNVAKLNLAEAELCKVSLNAYITTKISFANYLGLLAAKVDPDINVDNVTGTIGMDKRIGGKYFKAGASYGGTCFPRDTWAFVKVSEKVGLRADQMYANETINQATDTDIINRILESDPKSVGLIGLGFKPGTTVVTEGLAEKLAKRLTRYNIEVHAHDLLDESYINLVQSVGEDNLGDFHFSINTLLNEVDVVVFCNNEGAYFTNEIPSTLKVIDPWRVL